MVASAALMVLIPSLKAQQLQLLGLASASAGLVGLSVFISWDLTRWLATAPPDFRRYSFQRILFTIGTNTDLPLIHLTAVGAVCWFVGTLRKRRGLVDSS